MSTSSTDQLAPSASKAGVRDLRAVLNPSSIVIVGASERSGGTKAALGYMEGRFAGKIYAVNPGRNEVLGMPCYPSVKELPEVPDLALLVVGRSAVAPLLRECAEVGIRAAVINADGYAESRLADGKAMQDELTAIARETGIRIVGPNGLGLANLATGAIPFCAPVSAPIIPGRLAIISQSGGNCCGFVESAIDRGVGISHLVSAGNEADLGVADYLDYLVDDENVAAFCLYIEAIRDPEAFMAAAARARAAGKPVVAIKVGRSEQGRASALAHTGAIAGSDAAVNALFQQVGVQRARTIDEALDMVSVMVQLPRDLWPKGRRALVFTVGGGAAGIVSDLAADARISVPPLPERVIAAVAGGLPEGLTVKNPIDIPGFHTSRNFDMTSNFIAECLADDSFDFAILAELLYPSALTTMAPVGALQARLGKPIIVTSPSRTRVDDATRAFMAETGLALVPGLGQSIRAIDAVVSAVEERKRSEVRAGAALDPAVPGAETLTSLRAMLTEAQAAGRRTLDPSESAELLRAYGIAIPEQEVVRDEDSAATAALRIGYPVALKVAAPGVLHKTEVGGIRLGLRSEIEVRDAFSILSRGRNGESNSAVLVQGMAQGGLELIVGVSNFDRGFPPTVVVGMGGILVELMRDTCTRVAPVSPADAAEMLESLQGGRLLRGFRNQPELAAEAAAVAVSAVSRIAVDFGDLVAEMDLNPLIVGASHEGAKAVDALVVLALRGEEV